MSIEDTIAKLPENMREPARKYISILVGLSEAEVERWVNDVVAGRTEEAYKFIIAKMDTKTVLAEISNINKALSELNKSNAAFVEIQRELVRSAVAFFITMAVQSL